MGWLYDGVWVHRAREAMTIVLMVIGVLILAVMALESLSTTLRDRREKRHHARWVAEARRRTSGARPPGWPRELPPHEVPTRANYPEPGGADTWKVKVYPDSAFDRDFLLALGGVRRDGRWFALEFWGEYWIFTAGSEREWATLLGGLRDAGVVFLGAGPGWHLGGEFDRLREAGLVSGPYHRLEFLGPGRWRVRRDGAAR